MAWGPHLCQIFLEFLLNCNPYSSFIYTVKDWVKRCLNALQDADPGCWSHSHPHINPQIITGSSINFDMIRKRISFWFYIWFCIFWWNPIKNITWTAVYSVCNSDADFIMIYIWPNRNTQIVFDPLQNQFKSLLLPTKYHKIASECPHNPTHTMTF